MWLEIAEDLPLGSKIRVRCCGRNKDAIISHNREGYGYYCFRCDTRIFHSISTHTLAQLAKVKELNEQPTPVEIPEDFTPVIPLQHRLWLYKAGVDDVRAMQAGIGWSDSLQRIILPLYSSNGELLYFQCRAVHKGQLPKYVNPPINKRSLLYLAGRIHTLDQVVVTEDILSAIRVGKHVPAVSILGTKTSDEQAGMLSDYKLVSYWLDPDEAGVKGSRAGAKKLSLVTNTSIITSNKDPKCYPDRVIREILGLPYRESYTYHGCLTTADNETPEIL